VLKALREDRGGDLAGKSAFLPRQAFAVGGAIMALAGALQAHFTIHRARQLSADPDVQVWVVLIVGGSAATSAPSSAVSSSGRFGRDRGP
jgi:branched-chain amino acid transport system permease protein